MVLGVQGLGIRMKVFRFKEFPGLRVQGLGLRVKGSWFRTQVHESGVPDKVLRVLILGFDGACLVLRILWVPVIIANFKVRIEGAYY